MDGIYVRALKYYESDTFRMYWFAVTMEFQLAEIFSNGYFKNFRLLLVSIFQWTELFFNEII